MALETLLIIGIPILVIFLIGATSIRVISQYENGVILTLGKYTKTIKAGLQFIIPIFQSLERVDMRQRATDLPKQKVMTKDQVSLTIDGVVFWSVDNAACAILNVQNVGEQLVATCNAALKEIIGEKEIAQTLSQREEISKELLKKLEEAITDSERETPNKNKLDWGITVRSVRIDNVILPENMERAMAKQAEAGREKEAIVIRAKGELEAAKNYEAAAERYTKNPSALRLRELKTYEEIGKEQNTLMLVIPEGSQNNISLSAAALAKLQEGSKQ